MLSGGGRQVDLMNSDISDWRITFADTGISSNLGQRLKAVQKYVEDDEVFLANYADGLADLHLPTLIERFQRGGKIGNFVSVRPNELPRRLRRRAQRRRNSSADCTAARGGFFMFQQAIFDYLCDGEELVLEPFQRLIAAKQLTAYAHDGFFAAMDTFKDKMHLEELYARGNAPWEVWRTNGNGRSHPA